VGICLGYEISGMLGCVRNVESAVHYVVRSSEMKSTKLRLIAYFNHVTHESVQYGLSLQKKS
jgi:hypothetical protein